MKPNNSQQATLNNTHRESLIHVMNLISYSTLCDQRGKGNGKQQIYTAQLYKKSTYKENQDKN